jgi:hypothetical protein
MRIPCVFLGAVADVSLNSMIRRQEMNLADTEMSFKIRNYVLDSDRMPVPCSNIVEWGQWFETSANERKVAETFTELMWISTVFLGTDYNFLDDGPPVLWETMVFDKHPHTREIFGELREVFDDHDCWRWNSLEEAKEGHARIVMDIIRTEQANAMLVQKALTKAMTD